MTRTRQLVLAGLAVMVVMWLVGGCGGSDSGPQSVAPMGLTQARAPVVADAAGLAKVIIGFKQQPGANERALVQGRGGKLKYVYHIIPAIAATIPQQAVDALQRNPNVEYVEGDAQVQALDDELVWGADRIDAEIVWGGDEDAVNIAEDALTGAGVKVAILDSGIDYSHPDLNDNYVVGGYDFVNDDNDPMDDYGHGTHCAGIVGAADNGLGIIQVAPKASLYALKVLDASGAGYYSDIIAALQWCKDNGMQVASMSFGGPFRSKALQNTCDSAYSAGVLLVAAAGNSGNPRGKGNNVEYPARYESVIAVAATDQSDQRASFSSTGDAVELAAPGVNINSTKLGGGYVEYDGTSMAAPHVAGTAALVIDSMDDSGAPSAAAVRDQMNSTAEDLGNPAHYGYGLVDAEAAVGVPAGNQPPVADAGPDQSGLVGQELTFDGSDSYDSDGTIMSYEWDFGDGTPTTEPSTDPTTTHAYTATDEYTVTLTVTDNDGATDTDTCLVNVTTGGGTGAIAGKVRNSTGRGIRGAKVTVDSGQSATTNPGGRYKIEDVPAGDHQVTASAFGYQDQTKPATVLAGETTRLDFALEK